MRILIMTMLAMATLAGCSSTSSTAEPPTIGQPAAPKAEPLTQQAESLTEEAARSAAEDTFADYAAGDYEAAYDRYPAKIKKLISKADYLRLHEMCPPLGHGVKPTIEKVTMTGRGAAKVRVGVMEIATQTYRMTYEGGQWRVASAPDVEREFRTKTVKEIVRDRRAEGACQESP